MVNITTMNLSDGIFDNASIILCIITSIRI